MILFISYGNHPFIQMLIEGSKIWGGIMRWKALSASLRQYRQSAVAFINRDGLLSAGDADGQGLVEYALILVLVVLVAIVVLAVAGPWIGNVFSNVINNI